MKAKLTKRTVESQAPGERDQFIWDTELKGFGLKITPAGNRIYIVQYRAKEYGTSTRRYTMGRHGTPWTTDQARTQAKKILGDIANGLDPQKIRTQQQTAITIADLCDQYILEGCEGKKPSTLATDKGRIERHIKPLLGNKKVKDLTRNDVKRFMADIAKGKTAIDAKTGSRGRAIVSGGKGTATRTVGLLGGILSFAVGEGIRDDNPVHGVKRYSDRKREHYLSHEDLVRLGEALTLAESNGESPIAIAAIRLLALTGCRKSEVLTLLWKNVDFDNGCLRLPDTKTGEKVIMLGAPALKLLATIQPVENCPFVFPSLKTGRHLVGLPKVWLRVRKLANLNSTRLHDLRHSFASIGASSGMGLQLVGKLLGHTDPKTTARYAHIADDPARVAANSISTQIASSMDGNPPAMDNVTPLRGS